MEDNQQTVSSRRMYIQELALLSLVRRGECKEPVMQFGRQFYKIKCDNPWEPTPKEERTTIPQIEIHTP